MAENVAADIGISVAAVRELEERGSTPSLAVFGRMVGACGPPLLHAVFGWGWLDEHQVKAQQIELESSIARQRAELAALREARTS